MEKLVNACIRRDVEEITGGNWLGVSYSIENALDIKWFGDLVPYVVHEPLRCISENLKKVYNKYFIWDESSGKEPIDLYLHVYENGNTVLAELTEGLKKKMEDGVVSYYMRLQFEQGGRHFPLTLLKVGETHKFDKAFIEEYIFPEDDDFEEA